MDSAEVALEAWAWLQGEALAVSGNGLAASLPNLQSVQRLDSFKEQTLLVPSQSCPIAREAEASMRTLEKTLERSCSKGGDVHFITFWRSLGEVSNEAELNEEVTIEAGEVTDASDQGEYEAQHTLPIGPLGPGHLAPLAVSFRSSQNQEVPELPRPKSRGGKSLVMQDLEELRDIMLDHFEASRGHDLPMATFYKEVQEVQRRSSTPDFWEKVSTPLGRDLESGECINISDLTVFLLLWLREAAVCELPESEPAAKPPAPGAEETSPAACSEADLPMLAQHLQQALESTENSPPSTGSRSYPSVITSTAGYQGTVKPNMRTAMLTLSCDMAQLDQASPRRGWMRSALLPRCNDHDDMNDRLHQEETMSLSLCRQPGLREAASRDLFNESAPLEADQNEGDFSQGNKEMSRDPVLKRTAARPLSPLPSLEPVQDVQVPMERFSDYRRVATPVFLHVYDVTQERAIRRLNKVLAHKRMPLKFGGIFHAGVEVCGTEWSYGCTESEEDPGVLPNLPKMHPDHHYRQTVEMRCTNFSAAEVGDILEELSIQYTGPMYDLLRKNCCHFADDFCQRLGVGCIPAWVYRLARIAARIESLLQAAQRIRTPG